MAIYPEVPSLPASICDPRRAAGVRPGAALVWAVFVALACAAFGAGCAGTAGGDAPDSAADILEDADSGDTAAVDTAPGEGLSCQRRDWRAATQRVVLRDARPLLRCANQRTLLVPRVLGDLPAGQARLWRYDVASGASGPAAVPPVCDDTWRFSCGMGFDIGSSIQSLPIRCAQPLPVGPGWRPHGTPTWGSAAIECVAYDAELDVASPEPLFTVETPLRGYSYAAVYGERYCSYSGDHFRRFICRLPHAPWTVEAEFQEVQWVQYFGPHVAVLHDRDPVLNASVLTVLWGGGGATTFEDLLVSDVVYDVSRDTIIMATVGEDDTLDLRTVKADGSTEVKFAGLRPNWRLRQEPWSESVGTSPLLQLAAVDAGEVVCVAREASGDGTELLRIDLDTGTSEVVASGPSEYGLAVANRSDCTEPTPWVLTFTTASAGERTCWLYEPAGRETRIITHLERGGVPSSVWLRHGVAAVHVPLTPSVPNGGAEGEGTSMLLATDTAVAGAASHLVGGVFPHDDVWVRTLEGETSIVTHESGGVWSDDSPTFTTGPPYYRGRVTIQDIEGALESVAPQGATQEFNDVYPWSTQCGECIYLLAHPDGEAQRGFDVLEVCPGAS